jgi:hypothetical protein
LKQLEKAKPPSIPEPRFAGGVTLESSARGSPGRARVLVQPQSSLRSSSAAWSLALALAGGVACTGFVAEPHESASATTGGTGSGSGSGGAGPGAGGSTNIDTQVCTSPGDTGTSVLRRLSKVEYQLTLQELFRLAESPDVSQVPEDSDQEGFRTIAEFQNVSDQHLRAYVDTAAAQAEALMADAARRSAVLGCEPEAAGCLESFVSSFGKLAYRRPLTAVEVGDLVERAEAAARTSIDRYQFAIESLLASAGFLFRVEVGAGSEPVRSLSAAELAARLSFTLWGRGPSEALLARAEQGELDSEQGLSAVAAEMLADSRAQQFYRPFFKQWLKFERLRAPVAPPPGWSDALLADMIGETERVLDDFAWGAGASLLDALTANFTYVTPALATFYGLSASGSGFSRVEFPAGHQRERSGLLTHAALISEKTDADLISMRGKWLRGAFLCEKLQVPAGLLETLDAELSGLSYVQVIEKRNTEDACAGCHALIDPIGVGFARYDDIGHYDASVEPTDYGLTPSFDGAPFGSIAELSSELVKNPKLAACMAEKVFVYVYGRFPTAQDLCGLELVGERFAERGHDFKGLLSALVEAPAFRARRAPQ